MMTPRKMFAHALMASLALATLSSGAMAQGTDLIDLRGEPAPPAAGKPYAARNLPDRIH